MVYIPAARRNDFFRWSPRTPTTGYFLATLQFADVSQLYEGPRKASPRA